MTLQEYLFYSLKNRLYRNMKWFYSLFVITLEQENEYIKIVDNKIYVKIYANKETLLINKDFTLVKLDNTSKDKPAYTMGDKFKITKEYMENLSSDTETYLGRILVNKLMLADVFGNKIPFIDKPIRSGLLEDIIAKEMFNDRITVPEYLEFIKVVSYMHGLSRITTIAATPKTMLPPKGIESFKKKLIAEFKDMYGEDWVKDRAKIVEFETALKAFDAEWLAGDPTLGKLTSGKVKDGARAKMYLTFGAERGFDKKSGKANLVTNSLLEGFPKDKDLLTDMFNTSRSGSFDRGKETQKGGAAAKDILRAVSSLTISDKDCGTYIGKTVNITEANFKYLVNRYLVQPDKTSKLITDGSVYVGKTVTMRSPQYCKELNNQLCPICVGKAIADYKKGISILVTDISAILLATSMAAMHFKTIQTMTYEITEAIR